VEVAVAVGEAPQVEREEVAVEAVDAGAPEGGGRALGRLGEEPPLPILAWLGQLGRRWRRRWRWRWRRRWRCRWRWRWWRRALLELGLRRDVADLAHGREPLLAAEVAHLRGAEAPREDEHQHVGRVDVDLVAQPLHPFRPYAVAILVRVRVTGTVRDTVTVALSQG